MCFHLIGYKFEYAMLQPYTAEQEQGKLRIKICEEFTIIKA